MAESMRLAGSIAGFAFDVTVVEQPEDGLAIAGWAGDQPVKLTASIADEKINLSGHLLGKECIINGSKGDHR